MTSVGPVSAEEIDLAANRVADFYGLGVRTAPQVGLLPRMKLPGRNQYNADAVLAALRSVPLGPHERLLALCAEDGSTAGMNFVLGLAELDGRRCVVFLDRLRRHATPFQRQHRLVTTARHELGHLYGLRHCPDESCGMAFSATVLATDRKGPGFCQRCASKLRKFRTAR